MCKRQQKSLRRKQNEQNKLHQSFTKREETSATNEESDTYNLRYASGHLESEVDPDLGPVLLLPACI